MKPSATHLVLIPSYNTGGVRLLATVKEALGRWAPVWVVIDGSTDGSDRALDPLAAENSNLKVVRLSENGGKGSAVFQAAVEAQRHGFTHMLVMDSDGQHPVTHIVPFMERSTAQPECLVLGLPVFGPEVPLERLHGRKLSVGLVHFETFGDAIGDPLFGFRVYPIMPFLHAMKRTRAARGFDFDPEVVVRMVWDGVPTVNLPAPCRYLSKADGGVSHFHYLRDNIKMVWLHTRLITQLLLWRWPKVRKLSRKVG